MASDSGTSRTSGRAPAVNRTAPQGVVDPSFGEVGALMERFLKRDGSFGSAVCVYHRGVKVVDLWGGRRDTLGTAWDADTMAISFSTTKGVSSTAIHLLADRGELAYDDAMVRFWPEYGQAGKERTTIRHVLTHQAGLHRIVDLVTRPEQLLDWTYMTTQLASRPSEPIAGTRSGYHGMTYGYLVGEIVRRITGQSIGDFLRQEVALPLALDGLHIGTPIELRHRVAPLMPPLDAKDKAKADRRSRRAVQARRQGRITQALVAPGWDVLVRDPSLHVLDGEIPAANGAFTARSLARLYMAIASGGDLDGLQLFTPERTNAMAEVQTHERDYVTKLRMRWRLGYHQAFGAKKSPLAFGHYGFGGSGGMADLGLRLSLGYVTNDMSGGSTPFADTRILRLVRAARRAAMRCEREI